MSVGFVPPEKHQNSEQNLQTGYDEDEENETYFLIYYLPHFLPNEERFRHTLRKFVYHWSFCFYSCSLLLINYVNCTSRHVKSFTEILADPPISYIIFCLPAIHMLPLVQRID